MDPVDSRQVPRDWRYSGIPPAASRFRLQGYHLLWPGFPAGSTIATHHRRTSVIVPAAPTTPDMQRSRAYTCQVWALPFSLAATRGVEVSFLSCRYLDGSVPCVPYDTLWIHVPLMEGYSMPFPDLGDPRINACLRLPEDYRSLATSFIGSWCQGIPTCTRGSLTFLFARDRFTRISLSLTPACQRPCPRTVPWDVRERRSRRVTHLVPSPFAPRQRRSCRARRRSIPISGTLDPLDSTTSSTTSPGSRPSRPSPPPRTGDGRSRTDDLLVANQTLYQLSYAPEARRNGDSTPRSATNVGLSGLEPPTLRLSGVRSNHLSYRPTRCSRIGIPPRCAHGLERPEHPARRDPDTNRKARRRIGQPESMRLLHFP